jgi:hypothetical protein
MASRFCSTTGRGTGARRLNVWFRQKIKARCDHLDKSRYGDDVRGPALKFGSERRLLTNDKNVKGARP